MTKAGSAGVVWGGGWKPKKETFNIQLSTLNVQVQNVAPSRDAPFGFRHSDFFGYLGIWVFRHSSFVIFPVVTTRS
jgi:hypothetical protein